MAAELFPMIQPEISQTEQELPLCRECAWDFENDSPVYVNGAPKIVAGAEAVKVWAWNALQTQRGNQEIYSWDYGSEIPSLIGQAFSDELKKAEAARYLRECLLVNPYITDADLISITFQDGRLVLQCRLETIYGEAVLDV